MKKLFITLLPAGSGHFTFSQQIRFEPIHYKIEGSTNIFTAMIQDNQGYIWLGTGSHGIDRFDPANPNFLASNKVNSLFEA